MSKQTTSENDQEMGQSILQTKIVSIIRKYHNQKMQTNPCHREEEPHNTRHQEEKQSKATISLSLSLSLRDDCKTRMDSTLAL